MPEVASDLKRLQMLAQERASIENLVTKYRQYKATSKSLEETRAMLSGGLDEEMTTLIKQEIESLESQLDHLAQELKVALLPKDASDERDIIWKSGLGLVVMKPDYLLLTSFVCIVGMLNLEVGI